MNSHVISGLGEVINPDNIKSGIDLKELEHQLISNGMIEKPSVDLADKFNEELNSSAKILGIDFGTPAKWKPNAPLAPHPTARQALPPPPAYEPANTYDESDEDTEDTHDATTASPPSDDDFVPQRKPLGTSIPSYMDNELNQRTQEQERRSHIATVMGTDTGGFSFEAEKREDSKYAMLSDIDSMLSALADDGVDLGRIPEVTHQSSYEDIDAVRRILRHKSDAARCCSLADELLLSAAYGLEELFDGKRLWFGQYQPDLTGWHNSVNIKLRRMRGDTGQIVNSVLQDYGISGPARVALELFPSMFMYSRVRKQHHSQPGVFNDGELADATNNIRDKF